jgi:hypothetical protein
MNEVDRNTWNGIGAVLLFILIVVGMALSIECVYPYHMAKVGYVEVEGGRYVPANPGDNNDPRVDVLAKQTQDVIVKLQRQINELKRSKKDK